MGQRLISTNGRSWSMVMKECLAGSASHAAAADDEIDLSVPPPRKAAAEEVEEKQKSDQFW